MFGWDQLVKIHLHSCKECVKIRKVVWCETDLLKSNEDVAALIHRILLMFV